MEEYWKVLKSPYEFSLIKKQSSFANWQSILYMGGTKKGCVELVVNNLDVPEAYHRFADPLVAKMPVVEYDNKCALSPGGLLHGEGTRIMVRTAIEILIQMYPHVKHLELDDASNMSCTTHLDVDESTSGQSQSHHSVSLPHLSIFTSGMTWYEKHFRATLPEIKRHSAYREKVSSAFQTPLNVPFEVVFHEYLVRFPNILLLVPSYASTASLNDMAKKGLDTLGKDKFCETIAPWLENFVNQQLKGINVNSVWTIDLSNFTQRLSTFSLVKQNTLANSGGAKKVAKSKIQKLRRRTNGFSMADM